MLKRKPHSHLNMQECEASTSPDNSATEGMLRQSSTYYWSLNVVVEQKRKSHLHLVIIGSCLSSFNIGFDIGIISGALLFIIEEFHLSSFVSEFYVRYALSWELNWFWHSSMLIGALIASLVSGPLCDKLGRKPIILSSSLVRCIAHVDCYWYACTFSRSLLGLRCKRLLFLFYNLS